MGMDETRARLLDAAGFEFAEKGYEGATARSICDRAGVNLAAINYHFGDKERLYEAVLTLALRSRPTAGLGFSQVDPRRSLHEFVTRFLDDILDDHSAPWHQGVMAREIAMPSKASDNLVRESFRPRFEQLTAIIRELLPAAEERRVHAIGFSVVGQCLHYKMSRSISERIVGVEAYGRLDAAYLADHITRFTLAALGHTPPLGSAGANETVPSPPMTEEGSR